MSETSTATFDRALADYGKAAAEAMAAVSRSADARRAVIRSRPAGMTSLEVSKRLRAINDQVTERTKPASAVSSGSV
jgi:hypothetical protein